MQYGHEHGYSEVGRLADRSKRLFLWIRVRGDSN